MTDIEERIIGRLNYVDDMDKLVDMITDVLLIVDCYREEYTVSDDDMHSVESLRAIVYATSIRGAQLLLKTEGREHV